MHLKKFILFSAGITLVPAVLILAFWALWQFACLLMPCIAEGAPMYGFFAFLGIAGGTIYYYTECTNVL